MTGEEKREAYEAQRRQHRADHPIIESAGPFVITPELERQRAERIARQQWREPEAELTVTDIPLRVGLLSQ